MKTDKRAVALTHTQQLAASWRREIPGRDLSNYLLAIYLMRIGRILDDHYDSMCRANYRISGADMRVLFALRRAGAPYARRPTDLYRSLLVTSGAITKQVDRLSKLGFVGRRSDPAHSGGFLVQLTQRGVEIADAANDVLTTQSVMTLALEGLNKAERAEVQRLCEHMLVRLDKTQVPETGTEHYGRRGRTPKSDTGTLRNRSTTKTVSLKGQQARTRSRIA